MVWIGVGPCLDRPRSEPQCVCMLQLGWTTKRKRKLCRQQVVRRRSKPYNLQACPLQPGGATIVAWLSHCFALQQVQLRNLTAWQRGFTTICLGRLEWRIAAGHQTQKHATITGPHINSPIHYIVPKIKCGFPRFEKPGSCLGPGLKPDLQF